MDCIAKLKAGVMHEALVGPDRSNSVLMTIPGGIQFPVKRTFGPTAEGLMWFEIASPEGPGWLPGSAVDVSGEGCPQPEREEEQPVLTLNTAAVAPVQVTATEATTTPDATAAVVSTLEGTPQVAPVVAVPALSEKTFKVVVMSDNGVRVRSAADTNASVLVEGLRKGLEAIYLETNAAGDWVKVKLYDKNQTEGWMTAQYAQIQDVVEKQVSPNIAVAPDLALIDVPYHSQEDADAKAAWSDCGPTSLRMIIGWNAVRQGKVNPPDLTIDQVVKTVGIGAKEFSSFRQLIPAARTYGLEMYHTNQATIPRIKREVDAGRPTLQLVRYGSFSGRMFQRFTAGHFLVVVGYTDTHIIVNDPYWGDPRRDEGHNFHIPLTEFEHAIGPEGSALAGNMPYQALFLDTRSL